ncbi:outer membrane protein [Terriglobus saanensis]|uniref:OmpA family protein n=1 Tax=Terriglobus saanensis (strain ATCC BAA-1853 / DSM 23119 / SP1PR4) TaxID=401053 RepID=E8UZT6_TERSS|nr:OmpA family protein [Terriglobus saanensis]ADV81013.1 OmpA family protein [Terriglobus saanensis SP1PR4]
MRLTRILFSIVLMIMATTACAQAIPSGASELGQTVSKEYPIALSLRYSATISNAPPGTCGCFLMNGGSGEVLFYVWKHISLAADVTGNHTDLVPQSQQGLGLITYMAGPRYSFHPTRRLTLYGQFLVGGVHGFDSYFPRNNGRSSDVANSFAYSPGGGVEIGVKDWLSVRAVEGEYLSTHLPNDLNAYQHNLRLGSGVVFRFSTKRINR